MDLLQKFYVGSSKEAAMPPPLPAGAATRSRLLALANGVAKPAAAPVASLTSRINQQLTTNMKHAEAKQGQALWDAMSRYQLQKLAFGMPGFVGQLGNAGRAAMGAGRAAQAAGGIGGGLRAAGQAFHAAGGVGAAAKTLGAGAAVGAGLYGAGRAMGAGARDAGLGVQQPMQPQMR
jgi:hypothetical protein